MGIILLHISQRVFRLRVTKPEAETEKPQKDIFSFSVMIRLLNLTSRRRTRNLNSLFKRYNSTSSDNAAFHVVEDEDDGEEKAKRSGRSFVGRGSQRRNVDLNFSFEDWNEHMSVARHFKHFTPGALRNSATFRRLLFPDLFVVLCVGFACFLSSSKRKREIRSGQKRLGCHHQCDERFGKSILDSSSC